MPLVALISARPGAVPPGCRTCSGPTHGSSRRRRRRCSRAMSRRWTKAGSGDCSGRPTTGPVADSSASPPRYRRGVHRAGARLRRTGPAADPRVEARRVLVVEKTPSHSLHVELIARYTPQCGSCTSSATAATCDVAHRGLAMGLSWGAPRTVSHAAKIWADHVAAAGPWLASRCTRSPLRGPASRRRGRCCSASSSSAGHRSSRPRRDGGSRSTRCTAGIGGHVGTLLGRRSRSPSRGRPDRRASFAAGTSAAGETPGRRGNGSSSTTSRGRAHRAGYEVDDRWLGRHAVRHSAGPRRPAPSAPALGGVGRRTSAARTRIRRRRGAGRRRVRAPRRARLDRFLTSARVDRRVVGRL